MKVKGYYNNKGYNMGFSYCQGLLLNQIFNNFLFLKMLYLFPVFLNISQVIMINSDSTYSCCTSVRYTF